jgi:hypothetical protein
MQDLMAGLPGMKEKIFAAIKDTKAAGYTVKNITGETGINFIARLIIDKNSPTGLLGEFFMLLKFQN